MRISDFHNKDFPFVTIGIGHPHLVLQRIAAVGVLLLERGEPLRLEPLGRFSHGRGGLHLNSQVIQRARPCIRRSIEREIQAWFRDIEFRIPRFELHRLETKERAIETHGLVEARRVKGDVNLHTAAPFRADIGTRRLRVQHSAYRKASRSRSPAASARHRKNFPSRVTLTNPSRCSASRWCESVEAGMSSSSWISPTTMPSGCADRSSRTMLNRAS